MSRQSRQGVDKRIDRRAAAEILSISQRTLDRYIKTKRLYSRKAAGHIWLDEEDVLCFKKAREQGVLENLIRQHRDIKNDENYGIIKLDTSRHGVDTSRQTMSTLEVENSAPSGVEEEVLHNDKHEENGVAHLLHHISQEVQGAMQDGTNVVQLPQTGESGIITREGIYTPQSVIPAFYYSEGIYQKLYEELKEEHKHNQKRIEAANYKVGQLSAQIESMVPQIEYRRQKEGFHRLESGLKTQIEKREIQLKKARRLLRSEQMNKWIFAILALTLIALQPVIWLLQR